MIDRDHDLSLSRQAKALRVSRGAVYYKPRPVSAEDSDYNEQRPHQGRWCFGKTPMQTFLDAMPMTKEKMIAA